MNIATQLSQYQQSRRMGHDLLASVLKTDAISLRRLLNGSAPETDNHARAEAAIIAAATILLRDAPHASAATPKRQVAVRMTQEAIEANLHATRARNAMLADRHRVVLRHKKVLRARGLRVFDIADLLGISRITVTNWGRQKPPSVSSLEQLSRLVDVTSTMNLGKPMRNTGPHPMIETIRERLDMSTMTDKRVILGMAKGQGNCDPSASLSQPIRSSGRNDLMVSLPEPPTQTTFTTDDDLVIIRRVYDSIERLEVAS